MPRRRKDNAEISIRDLMIKEGYSPVAELLREVKAEIPISEDDVGDPITQSMLNSGYELARTEKGLVLRLNTKLRTDIAKELIQYLHPKLRSAEVKETKDWNITIKIANFGGKAEKVLNVKPVVEQITEGIKP